MSKKSISHCQGKGSLSHNNRTFKPKNVDSNRTHNNIIFVQEPIEQAYEKCFGKAIERYNSKQKRNDRKIHTTYFEHTFKHKPFNTVVTSSDKRKSFYEDLVQIGTMDDTRVGSIDSEIAKKCLIEYMKGFQERNPNFYVFNAVLHLDEATPHLHIDYIPLGHYKRGVDTQNSISQALREMGFDYAKDSINKWREHERKVLEDICKKYGIEISEPQKSRGYSYTVEEYKEHQTIIDEFTTQEKQLNTNIEIANEKYQEISTKLKPLQTLNDELKQVENIGETKSIGIFKKSTIHTLTEEEYQQLKHGYDKYVTNRDTLNNKLLELKEQNTEFWKILKDLSKREKTTNDYEQLQQRYQELEHKYNSLSKEKDILDNTLENLKQSHEKLSNQLEKNQYDLGITYQALANITKALGMLKHDGQYQVELSNQANNLIIAIQNYAIHFLKYQKQNVLADELNRTVGISKNIQVLINEVEKKHSMQKQDIRNNQLKPKKKGRFL